MNRAMKLPQAMPEDAGLEPRRQAVIDVLKDRFARGEILRDSMGKAGELVRGAFESTVEPAAEQEAA